MKRRFPGLWPLASGLVFVMALLLNGIAQAQEDESRYLKLINELRCLVCQNQTIADSSAPLANDLREQVKAQIAAGKSDEEIIAFLTERYGDFVRYRPAFKPQTWLLWVGPFAVLLGAAVGAVAFARRSRGAKPAAIDPAQVQRLLDEVKKP